MSWSFRDEFTTFLGVGCVEGWRIKLSNKLKLKLKLSLAKTVQDLTWYHYPKNLYYGIRISIFTTKRIIPICKIYHKCIINQINFSVFISINLKVIICGERELKFFLISFVQSKLDQISFFGLALCCCSRKGGYTTCRA